MVGSWVRGNLLEGTFGYNRLSQSLSYSSKHSKWNITMAFGLKAIEKIIMIDEMLKALC